LEQVPQEGLLRFAKLAARTKRWTCNLIEVTLLLGEWHDLILLECALRIKSAHPPIEVNVRFSPQ
jgi:hypothetical protein